MPTLKVNIINLSLLVHSDTAAEVWFFKDGRHEPFIIIGLRPYPLDGKLVSFGDRDGVFGAAPTTIADSEKRYYRIHEIESKPVLDPAWKLSDQVIPNGM